MKIQKITATTAAITMTTGIVALSATAALNSRQLLHLQDALFGKTAVLTTDDVNGDQAVNGFDLAFLKRSLFANTGESSASDISVNAETVKLTGRTLTKENTTWLIQSGSAAEFTVSGSSASVTLAGDRASENDEKSRPRYGVFVDGELIADELMDAKTKTVTLFEGKTNRTADVKIMLLSEAMNGAVGVTSLHVESSAVNPVVPAPKKELCIEFIGDSITCAYGVEGANAYESFTTSTENFSKSYAFLTAQKLNADYSAVSYSGHGIISGYSAGETANTDSLIPDCYGLASKYWEYNKEWDFASARKNDVVVINLGTNDLNYVSHSPDTRNAEFVKGYIAFLKMIREKNPDAFIICTVGTMGGNEEIYPLIALAVEEYGQSEKDSRVMSYESATQNSTADGIGSDWHPSAVTQQKSAYVLADKICQALGIESDQIGLDVAADAVYDVSIDETNGANAAFFVGYDKSFWINMVEGGNSSAEIEATLSGIRLMKNGTYRLEFECTTGKDVTIPVLLRGKKQYYESSFDCGADKIVFSEEFTVDAEDADAQLVFQIGGEDYYNVTLGNIRLTKIG